MTIAPTPKRNQAASSNLTRDKERLEAQFIGGADRTTSPSGRKTVVQIRLAPTLLERIDQEAERRGLSRSSWIQYRLSEYFDDAEGGQPRA